jgi:superfamily II DNA or RNA helicase
MTTTHEILLYQDDSLFCLANPPKGLTKEVLTIQVKDLVQDENKPWVQKTVKRSLKLYEVQKKDPEIIIGDQGHTFEIRKWMDERSIPYTYVNKCLDFPEPRFDLMHGFRFSQRELLEQALSKNKSGCIAAPTRYGKTTLIKNTLRAYPDVKTLVIAPGVDLISQLYEDIKEALPDRNVVMVGGDSKVRSQGDDITVCSSDSLDKCNTDTRLILADEPHTTVTDSRYPEIKKFETARKLAFGATLTGRFDNKDRLINGLFGEVLAERTFQEAVAEGAICPIECLLIQQDIGKTFIPLRNVAYKKLLFQNPTIAGITEHVLEKFVPKDYQTLMFIKNEKQAEYFQDFLTCKPAIAMAKKLNKKTRKAMMDSMASGEIYRCLASDIYAQGVTFSDLRCVVNLAGGGPYTNSIQKPGRLAEIRPNKKCGILIDFIFTSSGGLNFKNAASSLVYDSVERLKVYSKKGYGIHLATSQKQIEEFFEKFL